MYLKHRIFGCIFNIFSKFSIKNNSVSFISDSNQSFKGNLDYIQKELENRDNFTFNHYFKNKFSLSSLYKLATSKYIFLDDNFFPMAFMNFNKNTQVFQLWHAPGAFKKFGASSASNDEIKMLNKISKKTDYLFISSSNLIDNYAEAFQIDKAKIKAYGLPRADYFFENHDLNSLRKDFDKKYPQAKGKKLILYAPTFRDEEKYNNIFDYLDLDDFNKQLGEEYILLLRLHPKKFKDSNLESNSNYINCTNYKNSQELLLLSDLLITDYSSIMIEFALLNRPIIFFTYDFNNYLTKDRGFYFDFEKTVPGAIVKDSDNLIKVIKNKEFKKAKIKPFLKTQFNQIDGKASYRIVNFILNNGG